MAYANVVQAEFFTKKGKIVVRFFDFSGYITDFVADLARAKEVHDKAVRRYFTAGRYHRIFLNIGIRALGRVIRSDEKRRRAVVVGGFEIADDLSHEIAIECSDHSFRRMRWDEMGTVRSAMEQATLVYIFVFEPNGLYADKNKRVAEVLW